MLKGKEMNQFEEKLNTNQDKLKQIASEAVKSAVQKGASECEVSIGGVKGLSVTSRNCEVENIVFNRDNGMDITVYKNKKRGSASTTDLSKKAIEECIESALNIANYSDEDECAGIASSELLCTSFKDLGLVFDNQVNADFAVKQAIELEQLALDQGNKLIKNSDGASFDSNLYTSVLANSNGFCQAKSSSCVSSSLVLLGEHQGKMQRGSGYSVARSLEDLYEPNKVVKEAIDRTTSKLDSKSVPTGKYNVIFSRSAVASLWGMLASAISGGAIYRRSSFLCDKLGEQIFPNFVTVHEDPFVVKGLASRNFDGDGVLVTKSDLVSDGILRAYLLGCYSAKKLQLTSNGHASGIHNWFVSFDKAHTYQFDDLLSSVNEGLVITDLMGQGIDMVSGNYSRGAEGYYFKNGKFEHAVDGITIAGNIKDMFMNMSAMATDIDERMKIKTGSVLIPNLTVSGL